MKKINNIYFAKDSLDNNIGGENDLTIHNGIIHYKKITKTFGAWSEPITLTPSVIELDFISAGISAFLENSEDSPDISKKGVVVSSGVERPQWAICNNIIMYRAVQYGAWIRASRLFHDYILTDANKVTQNVKGVIGGTTRRIPKLKSGEKAFTFISPTSKDTQILVNKDKMWQRTLETTESWQPIP